MSWGGLYGGAWGTSEQSLAKEDTRLLLLGSATADDSQYATDLTASGAGGYETNSARTAVATACEYYVRVTTTAAESNVVFVGVHNAAINDYTYALATDGSGYFRVMGGAGTLWTGPATPAGDCSFSFSTRPNPRTTGASDAQIAEVVIFNHTTSSVLALGQFVHATPTASAGYTLSVNGVWSGVAMALAPANAADKVRVSGAWHPHTEAVEDWIVERTAYAGSLDDVPIEPVPVTVASGLGDSGKYVGRAQLGFAIAQTKAVRRRQWSPLVNEAYMDAGLIAVSSGEWSTRHLTTAPGSAAYQMPVHLLRWCAVPRGATHARVRVHVQSWVTAGAAVPIGIRVYAMNRPPNTNALGGLQAQPLPDLDYAYATALLTEDHTTTGVGEWLSLGLVRLPVVQEPITGWQDTVHLCLAYAIDPAAASANDPNARIKINAWSAMPVEIWTPGGFGG